jgi:hypothetical protein
MREVIYRLCSFSRLLSSVNPCPMACCCWSPVRRPLVPEQPGRRGTKRTVSFVVSLHPRRPAMGEDDDGCPRAPAARPALRGEDSCRLPRFGARGSPDGVAEAACAPSRQQSGGHLCSIPMARLGGDGSSRRAGGGGRRGRKGPTATCAPARRLGLGEMAAAGGGDDGGRRRQGVAAAQGSGDWVGIACGTIGLGFSQ